MSTAGSSKKPVRQFGRGPTRAWLAASATAAKVRNSLDIITSKLIAGLDCLLDTGLFIPKEKEHACISWVVGGQCRHSRSSDGVMQERRDNDSATNGDESDGRTNLVQLPYRRFFINDTFGRNASVHAGRQGRYDEGGPIAVRHAAVGSSDRDREFEHHCGGQQLAGPEGHDQRRCDRPAVDSWTGLVQLLYGRFVVVDNLGRDTPVRVGRQG